VIALVAVNGLSFLTAEGATRLRNPVPGVAMAVTFVRNRE
jgi:hypothetical protein